MKHVLLLSVYSAATSQFRARDDSDEHGYQVRLAGIGKDIAVDCWPLPD
jgi:hypothetical protein